MFGPLWPYIQDEDITDIDWDGDKLWLTSIKNGTYPVETDEIDNNFVNNFSRYVANNEAADFNQIKNTLSTETDTLRITFVHESFARSGRCFAIRKSMPKLRFTAIGAIEGGYCDKDLMHLLVNAVKIHSNFAFCGEPNTGKTECAKFFSTFIKDNEKVITVEDCLEWHYKAINPGKRADEFKVNDSTDYINAIKVALRLNPTWLMLSEARSREFQYLIEAWSTGVHGFTTLHVGSVRDIPDRGANMVGQDLDATVVKNNIYSYLNIGILLTKEETEDGNIIRKIDQVGLFRHTDAGNECVIIVENGKFYKERIPSWFLATLTKNGITNPFFSEELQERIDNEKKGIFYGISDAEIEHLSSKTDEISAEAMSIDTAKMNINNIMDTMKEMNIMDDIQRG